MGHILGMSGHYMGHIWASYGACMGHHLGHVWWGSLRYLQCYRHLWCRFNLKFSSTLAKVGSLICLVTFLSFLLATTKLGSDKSAKPTWHALHSCHEKKTVPTKVWFTIFTYGFASLYENIFKLSNTQDNHKQMIACMLEHVFSLAMDSEDQGCPTFWRGFKAILK